ncbi:unnamed protein product [Arabis nemorensis]|uniref:Uncharacterized protein n=1 Tax=Arabis nemorensis TaxID=586526 RepID=A0A565BNA0_9BRAS|nr:unnamed protein product [Arabis nemorensis]
MSNPQAKLICLPHQVCQTSAASTPSDTGCLSTEELPPFPPFLARYEENRQKIHARDTLHPNIRQCAWRTYTYRFSTARAVRKFSFITIHLFNDMRIFQTAQPATRIMPQPFKIPLKDDFSTCIQSAIQNSSIAADLDYLTILVQGLHLKHSGGESGTRTHDGGETSEVDADTDPDDFEFKSEL